MTASGVETGWLSDFTACSNTTLSIELRYNALLPRLSDAVFRASILL